MLPMVILTDYLISVALKNRLDLNSIHLSAATVLHSTSVVNIDPDIFLRHAHVSQNSFRHSPCDCLPPLNIDGMSPRLTIKVIG
jgi:hypothetical protein